jgi:nucleotide-binding universal stress UspA family protein
MREYNRNILIAVDKSDNSRRAVEYVGGLLGGLPGFRATILHVIPEPEEDYFPTAKEKEAWLEREYKRIEALLEEYRKILIDAGFEAEDVNTRSTLRYCPSLAECILKEHPETYSTIVVGRKGHTRTEEFLFGSVSSKIVNYAKNCTVWVVG